METPPDTAPPPEDEDPRARAARQFISALPHCVALGMSIERVGAGEAVVAMPWSEEIVGDPRTGVVHGGAVSTLMDTSGGAAVLSHPDAPVGTATMDLRIDYMRAAKPRSAIRAVARCVHVTRSVAFVRAEASDEDGLVAVANGAFTMEGGA